MRRCEKCVMPDTRPGIYFDDQGVCQACGAEEQKNKTNWDKRLEELKTLCDKYRGVNGNAPDCVIAVSGGKDSHFQTYVMKELMGMNPLLVTVEDNFPMTEAGKHNIQNISEAFSCNIISLKPSIKVQKLLMRYMFEKYAKPTWFLDRLIYTHPVRVAMKFGIKLVIYGENVGYEYGGIHRVETYSAKDQINNGAASTVDWKEFEDIGLTMKDLQMCEYPSSDEMESTELDPIYLSYFVRWSSYNNYQIAKKLGFRDLTHEWRREHTFEDYDQVDSRAYLVHPWLKYPKFGHASATDYASKYIRYGLITREQGMELVRRYDHVLDQLAMEDFCKFVGYTVREFWEIVDKFYNPDLFERDSSGLWKLKE